MDSADPPLARSCLYAGRHHQLWGVGIGTVGGAGLSRLAGPLDAAPACLAPVHGSVLAGIAVRCQVAQRTTHRNVSRSIGVTTIAAQPPNVMQPMTTPH